MIFYKGIDVDSKRMIDDLYDGSAIVVTIIRNRFLYKFSECLNYVDSTLVFNRRILDVYFVKGPTINGIYHLSGNSKFGDVTYVIFKIHQFEHPEKLLSKDFIYNWKFLMR